MRLIVAILLFLSPIRASGADQYADSKWKPICSEDICLMKRERPSNPMKKNWIVLSTGIGLVPFKSNDLGLPYNPRASTFQLQYFRLLKDDFLAGISVQGHESGVSGWQFSVGAGF